MDMEEAYAKVRSSRNKMLELYVDYFQKPLLWETLSATEQQDLRDYRQALLDWPTTLQGIYGEDLPIGYGRHNPTQPSWFATKHPRGRMFS